MIAFAGKIWRLVPNGQDPSQPARAPQGRFHHSGQFALYGSLTPEGCGVAIKRYLAPDDPPRQLVELQLSATLFDLRGRPEASIVWQDLGPEPSPTWAFSDHARALAAQGLLYSSRSRPDLTHIVIFQPLELTLISASLWHKAQNPSKG